MTLGKDVTIEHTSVEYLYFNVRAEADPTANTVTVAMPLAGVDPTAPMFKTAEWVTGESSPATKSYVARFLFGSANFPAVDGVHYDVYLKITTGAEQPVLFAGQIHTT